MPAAGSGRRLGGARKAFLELQGEPLLARALAPFLNDDRVVAVCVALSVEDADDPPTWLKDLDPRVRVVAGGATRGASVANAVAGLPENVTVVAVHDAARPFVSAETVSRCIDVAEGGVGAVAGCPAVDTMKRVNDRDTVVETPPRDTLWHAHTPQVFPAEMLRRAYGSGDMTATDDAALVERYGGEVRMVDGGRWNLKITHPADIPLAEALLRSGLVGGE